MPLTGQTKPARNRERGAALLVVLTIIGLGAAFLLVSALNKVNRQRERELLTTTALAQAKAALLGWSLSRNDGAGNPRPGELPCPDPNAPGSPNYGLAAAVCLPGAIGRLPWKTLGIEELKDGYGEALWYTIDASFRARGSNSLPINSDTRASIQVYDHDGTTLLSGQGLEAAALIFAPGPILGAQVRGPGQQTLAVNYLDRAGPPDIAVARNNAANNGPFIHGPVKDSGGNLRINDRLLAISARELMQAVEKRVAREIKSMLAAYYSANGNKYPNPAAFNDPNCLDVGAAASATPCASDPGQCRGRLPDASLAPAPNWFSYNLWGQITYYAVGTGYLASSPANCGLSLTLNGTPGIAGLFILPGTPQGIITRNSGSQSLALSDYMEDAANQDGWTAIPPNTQVNADSYLNPGATANDKLQTLP